MTGDEARSLQDGLYFLKWVHGSGSVAAVGRDHSGNPWYAPANWVHVPWYDWSGVASAELLTTQGKELAKRSTA